MGVVIDGEAQCVKCDVGTYQPGVFADMCIDCPDGFTTRATGSTRLEDCEGKAAAARQHKPQTNLFVSFYNSKTSQSIQFASFLATNSS